eukprot:Sspe_Gene.92908::Locus_65659_Transcript_1_1_Confidence_1.000_Length_1645::g.92908::m.92908/K13984/TXNDC5, ERP46; thioredoxin domain-containing protein 5
MMLHVLFLTLALCVPVVVEGVTPEGSMPGVVELPSDFDPKDISKPHLVEFYTPSCGFCKRLAPEWRDLGEHLTDQHPHVVVAKIDSTNSPGIGERFGFRGFPTIILFHPGGRAVEFTNHADRTKAAFLKFLSDELNVDLSAPHTPVDYYATPEAAMPGVVDLLPSELVDLEGTWLLLFYIPKCNFCKRVAGSWSRVGQVARGVEGLRVGRVDCTHPDADNVTAAHNITGFPTIALFRGGELVDRYTNHTKRTTTAIMKWVAKSTGITVEVPKSVRNADKADREEHTWYYYWMEEEQKASEVMSLAALKAMLRSKKLSVDDTLVAEAGETEWRPANTLFRKDKKVKPAALPSGPAVVMENVVELSIDTFDEVVAKGKPWFVEFYAPECGFCKRMASEWAALGKAAPQSVTIAKLDCSRIPTSNPILERYAVTGFPTLVLIRPDGSHTRYTNHVNRHKAAFLDFLAAEIPADDEL